MTNGEHDRMDWRCARISGGVTRCGTGGSGPPVLFLHGWGLSGRVYEQALRRLVAAGRRVYAPSLPGFGGTSPLPAEEENLPGYADWAADFIEAVIGEPATVIAHSFGGGVSIQLAHDAPELVSRLVLVNAIGGSAWRDGEGVVRPMRERPLWDWGRQIRGGTRPTWALATALPRIVREAVPNLVRNPGTVWRVANVARAADLERQLGELRDRDLPVTVAWSDQDTVIPRDSYAALMASLGQPPSVVVSGGHGWLIDNADLFADVITDLLDGAAGELPAEAFESRAAA
jgi:pimeloyl-ACP methyl ester carboxylesterase